MQVTAYKNAVLGTWLYFIDELPEIRAEQ